MSKSIETRLSEIIADNVTFMTDAELSDRLVEYLMAVKRGRYAYEVRVNGIARGPYEHEWIGKMAVCRFVTSTHLFFTERNDAMIAMFLYDGTCTALALCETA